MTKYQFDMIESRLRILLRAMKPSTGYVSKHRIYGVSDVTMWIRLANELAYDGMEWHEIMEMANEIWEQTNDYR